MIFEAVAITQVAITVESSVISNHVFASTVVAITSEASATGPKAGVATTIVTPQITISTTGTFSVSASTEVEVVNTVSRIFDGEAETEVTVNVTAGNSRPLATSVVITQLAEAEVFKAVSTTLNITQVATANIIKLVSASTVVDIEQYISVTAPQHEINDCVYAPISDELPAYPTLTPQDNVAFYYPVGAGSPTVVLTTPEFSNTEEHEYSRIIRQTTGGTLQVYRRNEWPKTKRFRCTAKFNKYSDASAFIDFIETTAGLNVKYRDYLNRSYVGIILLDASEFKEAGRYDREINFTFEGELQ